MINPSKFPNLVAAEEAMYRLRLAASALTEPLMRLLDEVDLIHYDAVEERAPGTRPRPALRLERWVRIP